jgi:U32 family peptidase
LKIEGRGRAADYVYTVTSCYREAIDAINAGTYTSEKIKEWKNRLSTVFNRGFWDGYYLGRKMGEWAETAGSVAAKKKVYLAKGMKYFERAGTGEFKMETGTLQPGDEVLITGPATGVLQLKVEQLRVDGLDSGKAVKGEHITIPVPERIRKSDKLYKLVESK